MLVAQMIEIVLNITRRLDVIKPRAMSELLKILPVASALLYMLDKSAVQNKFGEIELAGQHPVPGAPESAGEMLQQRQAGIPPKCIQLCNIAVFDCLLTIDTKQSGGQRIPVEIAPIIS